MATINWSSAVQPLLKKYKGKPHPLEYKNLYQLLVLVVLSAQDSDKNINNRAPELFKVYPNMEALSNATEDTLAPFLKSIRSGRNKGNWLVRIAQAIKHDKNIPLTQEELTKLPGIGRKSANVIMREAKVKAEGVIVDLHVVRVAPRLGITKSEDPKKIEADIMAVIPQKDWGEIGMAISFLGREICRPKDPLHGICPMNSVCEFYAQVKSGKVKSPAKLSTLKKLGAAKKESKPAKKSTPAKKGPTKKTVVKKAAKKTVAKKTAKKKK
jgi:endonuclease-3